MSTGTSPGASAPLVEREAETRALARALADAPGGGGSLVVAGPAGIGKTTLVDRAADDARRLGFRVLTARSRPISREASFGLLRDWFDLPARRVAAGDPPYDGPAEVLRRLAEAPAVTDVGYGLRWVLDALSREQPVLLVADDLHWTDEASLSSLDLLVAALPSMPVLLLGAVRTGEEPAGGDLLGRIVAESRVISPEPLSVDGVSTVLAATPREGFVAGDLHRVTGGVPFLLRELLRTDAGVPRTVVESVAARLGRLPEGTVATARAVCVLQDVAAPALVAELSGRDRAATADDLRRLAEAEILTRGEVPSPVHPLVGDAVLAPLSTAQRSEMHLAAAGILSRDEARHADVTVHLLQTLPGDDLDVRERLHAAGRAALASGAAETAARYLTRACEEAPTQPVGIDLLEHTAQALAMSGDLARAVDLYDRAVRRSDDTVARAMLSAALGDTLVAAGRHEEAVERYGAALADTDTVQHHGTWQRLAARSLLSGLLTSTEDTASAIADVARIMAQPVEHDSHEDRLMLGATSAAMCFANQDPAAARAMALRSLGEGRLLEEETSDGAAYYLPTGTLNWTDAIEEDLAALTAAVHDAQARGSAMAYGTAAACRAGVYLRIGRFRDALADAAAVDTARDLGWRAYLPMYVGDLTRVHLRRGDLPSASALRADLVDQARNGALMLRATALCSLAELELAEGDAAEALAVAAQVAASTPTILPDIDWRAVEVEALGSLGRTDDAARASAEYLTTARAWGVPSVVVNALLADARHGEGAAASLEEALGLADSIANGWLQAQVRVELGAAPVPSDPARALDLLRAAEEYAVAESVGPLRARIEPLLYRLGEVPSTTDNLLARLTPGELTVARLVAEGLSNREIGQRLFVTRKTVEFHLSSIYRKLGTSSRQQLTAVVGGTRTGAPDDHLVN